MNEEATKARERIRAGRHLPKFLRDFHDQKDVFKLIARWHPYPPGDPYAVPWTNAHVYVIDRFLRAMALCGWTLQRARTGGPVCDLDTSIEKMKQEDAEAFRAMLEEGRAERSETR